MKLVYIKVPSVASSVASPEGSHLVLCLDGIHHTCTIYFSSCPWATFVRVYVIQGLTLSVLLIFFFLFFFDVGELVTLWFKDMRVSGIVSFFHSLDFQCYFFYTNQPLSVLIARWCLDLFLPSLHAHTPLGLEAIPTVSCCAQATNLQYKRIQLWELSHLKEDVTPPILVSKKTSCSLLILFPYL